MSYPPPQGQGYPDQGGYYPGPQQPGQAYGPPQGGYAPNPGPQTVYVVQQPPQKDSGGGGGCTACLAGMLCCCCAEEICDCIF
ncbi:hypothetical protein HDZ31DRAFT_62828 [Schizophyllum fasciatum]